VEEQDAILKAERGTENDGDFAVNQAETCGFETEQEAPRAHEWARQDNSGAQPRLFESLLARGQLGPAWMALNSPGWDLQEARDALGQLDLRAKDDDLGALVRAWLAVSANESGRH
jgi:hypothetical protein